MKKIPTIYQRDWDGDRSRVLPVPEAQWVFDGEGVPTVKLDGTCVYYDGAAFFKRLELAEKNLSRVPLDAILVEKDEETQKSLFWVPVGDGPEDRWFREGIERFLTFSSRTAGTYELVGPKVQGNPQGLEHHDLMKHGCLPLPDFPRTFDSIRSALSEWWNIEGVVWHHPDGRMAKIKRRDFGFPWPPKTNASVKTPPG